MPFDMVFLISRVKNFDKETFEKGLQVGLDLINKVKVEEYL